MVVIDFVWLRSELKNITAESRGAHVPQCPIAVDAINASSFLHVIYTISSRLVIWAFSIYSIIRIGHHSPTISWFDCSLKITSRSFWYAAPHLINCGTSSPYFSCSYQFDPPSSPSSSPSPSSDPGQFVDLSRGVFHSRRKSFRFSKSFPP